MKSRKLIYKATFSETDATLIRSRVSSHIERLLAGMVHISFVGTLRAMKIEKARCRTFSFSWSSVEGVPRSDNSWFVMEKKKSSIHQDPSPNARMDRGKEHVPGSMSQIGKLTLRNLISLSHIFGGLWRIPIIISFRTLPFLCCSEVSVCLGTAYYIPNEAQMSP